MRTVQRPAAAGIFFTLLIFAWGKASAQPLPAASEVLMNLERTFEGVNDLTATLEAEVSMERVRIPKMQATMYFKRPDKVKYSSEGFLMMPREGLSFNPVQLRERFDGSVEGSDTVGGMNTIRLRLNAKDPKARVRQLLLWVDPAHWTAVRLETIPYAGRKLQVRFTFEQVGQKYWLPSEASVQFSVAEEADAATPMPPMGREDGQRGMPRAGNMVVKYRDYKVNSGLKEEVFQER